MRKNILVITFLLTTILIYSQEKTIQEQPNNIHEISVNKMNGEEVQLSDYEGKVLLIVNVASECGYTPQYEGLQKLYETFNEKGFEILAFPCNDFGGQEPGTNEEIKEFCSTTFGVTFQLFDKIKVLGKEKEPLYEMLINNPTIEQGDIKWNFEKFLIAKNGDVVARYRSAVEPMSDEITTKLKQELAR